MQVDELFPEFGMPQQNGVALFLLDEENRPKLSNVTLNSDFRFPQTAGSQESVRCFSTEIQRVPLRVGGAASVGTRIFAAEFSAHLNLRGISFATVFVSVLFHDSLHQLSSSEIWR